MKPKAGEIVSDPAAGTLGFIIRADAWIKAETDDYWTLKTQRQELQKKKAFYAIELVPDARRLALMNAMKGGGTPSRDDFTFVTSNKQLAFLQHMATLEVRRETLAALSR